VQTAVAYKRLHLSLTHTHTHTSPVTTSIQTGETEKRIKFATKKTQ
jgi:hypothetical protein